MRNIKTRIMLGLVLLSWLGAACTPVDLPAATAEATSTPIAKATATVFQPVDPTSTPATVTLYLAPELPQTLRESAEQIEVLAGRKVIFVDVATAADIQIGFQPERALTHWVYAVAGAFNTVQDEIAWDEMFWRWTLQAQQTDDPNETAALTATPDEDGSTNSVEPVLILNAATAALVGKIFSIPAGDSVQIIADADLLTSAWELDDVLAIIPFEQLEPGWKVMRVDSLSPLGREFPVTDYPLTAEFGISGLAEFDTELIGKLNWPVTNRDEERMTVVVMTGVTALARATAWTMEMKGIDYPGLLIADWLLEADYTHISNESSFTPDCGKPQPGQSDLRFCSSPEYIDLFTGLDIDIIELTGNHLADYGKEPVIYTFDLYDANGITYFAGGRNLEEGLKPLLIEHNGNHIAFIGCNKAGPVSVWAQDDSPGAMECTDEVFEQVTRVRAAGYLPIFTYQWNEYYLYAPTNTQIEGFHKAADAGAVIVSGSQAHQPMGFEFYQDAFIHYGLGNLFFDQMAASFTREEFVDRHVFYDGRHISTEIYTAFLEDWAQPRPMEAVERSSFLEKMFGHSGW